MPLLNFPPAKYVADDFLPWFHHGFLEIPDGIAPYPLSKSVFDCPPD